MGAWLPGSQFTSVLSTGLSMQYVTFKEFGVGGIHIVGTLFRFVVRSNILIDKLLIRKLI
jgi:hypothetical protein